ncbi:MAG: peptidylprolyl isomerase [Vicingaceae bacterium]|nr:peptidylprolyl isomerase [Vicingaceae bacterium]
MKLFFILLTSLILFGCNETPTNIKDIKTTPTKKATEKTAKKINKLPPSFIPITNKTVVERLTQYGKSNPESIVDIYTTKGKIRVKLYQDTPLHRANFILLVKSGYLNGCLFSRVVPNFMAQCGGSYDELQKSIQDTLGIYTIPNEISRHHFHKKGAIGAARSYTNNPDKRSENDEIYFVEGTKYGDLSLDHYEDLNNYKFNKTQRNYYKNNKGAAHIDGEHTVFGEIISGYNVVPKLTSVITDSQDWPNVDLYVDSAIVVN